MKKAIIIFVLCGTVIAGAVMWFNTNQNPVTFSDVLSFAVVAVIVGLALLLGIRRIRDVRKGLPPEDELSKRILKTAAARSYYFSLYLWLGIMYLSESDRFDISALLGAGILGMALLLFVHWIIVKLRGLKDE